MRNHVLQFLLLQPPSPPLPSLLCLIPLYKCSSTCLHHAGFRFLFYSRTQPALARSLSASVVKPFWLPYFFFSHWDFSLLAFNRHVKCYTVRKLSHFFVCVVAGTSVWENIWTYLPSYRRWWCNSNYRLWCSRTVDVWVRKTVLNSIEMTILLSWVRSLANTNVCISYLIPWNWQLSRSTAATLSANPHHQFALHSNSKTLCAASTVGGGETSETIIKSAGAFILWSLWPILRPIGIYFSTHFYIHIYSVCLHTAASAM